MKSHLAILSALALFLACDAKNETAHAAGTAGRAPQPVGAASGLEVRRDVRHACTRVASILRAAGARALLESDTLVDSSAYAPRSMACLVDADSFRVAPRADLLHTLPPDSGWVWHEFEPVDNRTYGVVRDSVQCEVTPRRVTVAKPGEAPERARAGRFHVFCYSE